MKKLLTFVLLMASFLCNAQPITFITITGAGSSSDTAIRHAAPFIEKETGRSVVILNIPGAEGLLAINRFQNGDDSTFLIGNSSLGYLRYTRNLSIDAIPLTGLIQPRMGLFVNTNSGASSINDLVKKNNLTAAVTSSMVEVSVKLFDINHHTTSMHVNYKQFGQAVLDLAAGRIDYIIAPVGTASVTGMLEAGKLKQLTDLGTDFTWSAIYTKSNNQSLHNQIIRGLTRSNINLFRANETDITLIERKEQQLFRQANNG